jgi:hypothetical protein
MNVECTRRRLTLASLLCGASALVVACAFPDVTLTSDAHGSALSEAGADASAAVDGADGATRPSGPRRQLEEPSEDGETPGDEDAGTPLLIDGSSPDALVVVDAGAKVDAAGCTSCDCDGDGYENLAKAGCSQAGGPSDCDDADQRTHPSQSYLVAKTAPPRLGDWDCSGAVDKLWPTDVSCEGLAPLGLGCSDHFGFKGAPGCGEKGSWIRCVKRPGLLALDCIVGEEREETQACR